MFNNWINIHDLAKLAEKVSQNGGFWLKTRLLAERRQRVASSWSHTTTPTGSVWEIPALRRRWNQLVTGNPDQDHVGYISRKHLKKRYRLIALSPGCGGGDNELNWARTGRFRRIDAFDLSPQRIQAAREKARIQKLNHIVRFSVGDITTVASRRERYDLILFEGALHHFTPVKRILSETSGMLKSDGLLVINEFVGPSRFQWTRCQLRVANALLALLPDFYRRKTNGRIKKGIYRPGQLAMRLLDPSEAADSSSIMPCLKEMFEILEIKQKGGTILNLLFHGIAHHFQKPDETAQAFLELSFTAEDLLLRSKQIASDYVVAVCRPRPGRGTRLKKSPHWFKMKAGT